jgi:hypothetical protein
MKTFVKNFLPEGNINPINRDLLLVLLAGLVIALAIGTLTAVLIGLL